MKASSWKTTLGGLLAALGAALATLEEPWRQVGAALTAFGVALVGITARDRDVTSQGTKVREGAKP